MGIKHLQHHYHWSVLVKSLIVKVSSARQHFLSMLPPYELLHDGADAFTSIDEMTLVHKLRRREDIVELRKFLSEEFHQVETLVCDAVKTVQGTFKFFCSRSVPKRQVVLTSLRPLQCGII